VPIISLSPVAAQQLFGIKMTQRAAVNTLSRLKAKSLRKLAHVTRATQYSPSALGFSSYGHPTDNSALFYLVVDSLISFVCFPTTSRLSLSSRSGACVFL
jgi:hypothetical protein